MTLVCSPRSTIYTRPVPAAPGKGFRFVRVGALLKSGDEYYTAEGIWRSATITRSVVRDTKCNLYRRRIAA